MSSFGDNLNGEIINANYQLRAKEQIVSFDKGPKLLSVESTDGQDVNVRFNTPKANGLRMRYIGILTSTNGDVTGLPTLDPPIQSGEVYRNSGFELKIVP